MEFKYFDFKTKNFNDLLLLKSVDHSFDKVNIFDLLKKNIKIKKSEITIIKKKIKLFKKKIYVVAFGKMASTMTENASMIFDKVGNVNYFQISNVLDYRILKNIKNIKSYKSQHPVPGKQSVKATKKLIQHLKKIEKNSIIIFLVSGGGSSMISYPIKGFSLEKKIKLTKYLFSLNTEPKYLNYFRMSISRVKNGGLLKYIKTNEIFNFFISDENEDKISILSSGPTVNRQLKIKNLFLDYLKNNKNIREFLNKNDLNKIIANLNTKIIAKNIKNLILFKNFDFIKIIKKELKRNIDAEIFVSKTFLFGDYKKNLKKIEKIAKIVETKKKKFIYIFGAQIETPKKMMSPKKLGGRLQHITTDLLKRKIIKNVKILTIATDSQDYDPKVFGTLVDCSKKINTNKLNFYLKNFKTRNFHVKNKSIIFSKKFSNLNVKDIFIIYNF